MLTLKKNAIRYKDSDGTIKDTGVLCDVSVVGVNWFQYATSMSGFFNEVTFPENTEIEINLPNIKNLYHSFYYAINVRKIKISGNNNKNSVSADGTFWGASNVEVIDLTDFNCIFSNMGNTFRQCSKLKYIYGEIDCTKATSLQSIFMNDTLLEYVRFKKSSIHKSIDFVLQKNLTDETVQNIIDGLADLTGQTAQTLTFHSTVKAKLTEAQIATITSKNWTLA